MKNIVCLEETSLLKYQGKRELQSSWCCEAGRNVSVFMHWGSLETQPDFFSSYSVELIQPVSNVRLINKTKQF